MLLDPCVRVFLCFFVVLLPTAAFYSKNSNNNIRNSIRTYPGGFRRKLITEQAAQNTINDLETALKELKEFDDACT